MDSISIWIMKHFHYTWDGIEDFTGVSLDMSERPTYSAFVYYLWPLFVLALFAIVMMGVALILSVAIALTEAVTYIRNRRK